jgi:UDP-glucose 4-epimerase
MLATARLLGRRCLVTGAAGFIGLVLCRMLYAAGIEVHAMSRRHPGVEHVAQWHPCDVADADQVKAAMKAARPDVVFHLASIVDGSRDFRLVLPMLHSNLLGFVHVASEAAELGCSRIVTVGSLQEPDQTLPAVPNSPLAAAKYAASMYARMFATVQGLPVVIARPYMVYGVGQLDRAKVIPHIITRILAGLDVPLSTARHAFDWVFVDDVAEALIATAATPGIEGRTIDIGYGKLTTVADVARGLAARLNAPEALHFGVLPDRKLEPTRCSDVVQTEQLIGWRPSIALDEGLDRTVAWWRELQRAVDQRPS